MYIALYDEDINHITNLDSITYELTKRVYDLDTFSATGITDDEIKEAKILCLCDNYGNLEYSCFVDTIKINSKKVEIKGLDYKKLWQNEIILDYITETFRGELSYIFQKVSKTLFEDNKDKLFKNVEITCEIPIDITPTNSVLGSYQKTYQIIDGYKFLKTYLKYYEYNIDSVFDISNKKIKFIFKKNEIKISINLKDFDSELTTTATTTNKAIARVKTDSENFAKVVEKIYYLNKNNDVVLIADNENIEQHVENRIYPVVQKIFENEYLAKAQFEAVNELANSRYVDNIFIENDFKMDPIDFNDYEVYTKVEIYNNGQYYKTLPITEKILKLDSKGKKVKIKLGFKKVLLTEIIKS